MLVEFVGGPMDGLKQTVDVPKGDYRGWPIYFDNLIGEATRGGPGIFGAPSQAPIEPARKRRSLYLLDTAEARAVFDSYLKPKEITDGRRAT